MAIACFRLVTLPPLPPLPERSVPRFSRCMALFTLLPAAFPYLAIAFLLARTQCTVSESQVRLLRRCESDHTRVMGISNPNIVDHLGLQLLWGRIRKSCVVYTPCILHSFPGRNLQFLCSLEWGANRFVPSQACRRPT